MFVALLLLFTGLGISSNILSRVITYRIFGKSKLNSSKMVFIGCTEIILLMICVSPILIIPHIFDDHRSFFLASFVFGMVIGRYFIDKSLKKR